ncbi:hypothetical protein ACK1KB_13780 [Chryseobacterium sp. TY3]
MENQLLYFRVLATQVKILTKLVEVLLEDVEKVELIQNSQVNSMM